MRNVTGGLIIGILALAMAGWSAPYLGYVYPAGGQQGAAVRVIIGGQRINGVRGVTISGNGVSAKAVWYEGPNGPLNFLQRELLAKMIHEIIEGRRGNPVQPATTATPPTTTTTATLATTPTPATTPATPAVPSTTTSPAAAPAPANPPATTTPATPPANSTTPAAKPATNPATPAVFSPKAPDVKLPADIPELQNLDQKTNKELREIADKYLNRQKMTKPPIAEEVTLEVTIAPDATPGDHQLRLRTVEGYSNPMVFQVGQSPEICEKDRTDDKAVAPPPTTVPVVLNGQIMPGEVDRFALKLRAGQQLEISAQARHLIPYLADAVPGWCQAVLTLYDDKGKELAYAFNTGFEPDPSLRYNVKQDGDYTLAIRDAIYRGREDFVYRVVINELKPGQPQPPTFAELGRVTPDGVPAAVDPSLPFVDSRLPQLDEIEPNNTPATAFKITTPQVIKGRIDHPGDVDVYQFTGKAGDQLVAEVYARRLGSPLDSLLCLLDATGRVLALNDDHDADEMGLEPHHADSYLSAKLPADGNYYVQVSDVQQHGGDAYRYYLRVGPPQPDFVLRMTPSSLNVPSGGSTSFTVYAYRKDGFAGDITVTLKDAPVNFTLKGGRIPADKTQATVTLTAPRGVFEQPLAVHLEGHADIAGTPVTRPIVPCERLMQAFAYYHLVPQQEVLITVTRR